MTDNLEQNKPLVAIHCMVYNHAPYLRDCFEGFVMQQTNFPFVVAIVDDINNLPSKRGGKQPTLSDFQPITRDFAFITDVDTPADKLTSVASSADSRITNVIVFDSFDMNDGKKSIAFTITIQPTDNMSDSDLQQIQSAVITSVEKKCNATIRDK